MTLPSGQVRTLRTVVIAACLLLPALARAEAGQPAAPADPARVFSELEPIIDVDVSPDGRHLVMLRAIGETYQVAAMDLDSGEGRLLMSADPEKFLFNWCRFASDTRIVCSIRSYIVMKAATTGLGGRWYRDGRIVATRLLAIDVDGGNQLQLVPERQTRLGGRVVWNPQNQDTIVSWLHDDPQHVLVALAREDRLYPSVYRLNVHDNDLDRVQRFRKNILAWRADYSGRLVHALGYRRGGGYLVQYAASGRFEALPTDHLAGEVEPALSGYTPDAREAWVVANVDGADRRGLYRIDARTANLTQTVLEDAHYDIDSRLIWHPQRRQPIAATVVTDVPEYRWFDAQLASEMQSVRDALPGRPRVVRVMAFDRQLSRMVLRASDGHIPPAVYLYQRAPRKPALQRLATSYAEADPALLAPIRPVTYTSRDGLEIPAFVAVPNGREGQRLPTIILVHGGPYVRTDADFDYWMQYFVARGFAVLKPNYRGSFGYGQAFMRAGFEQWGLNMQTDLDDGRAWLVEQGIADPGRVCIVGGSYGGYAAMVAAFKTPDLYLCAVSFAGVSDLDELVQRWSGFMTGNVAVARVQSGALRDRLSPLKRVDDIAIPLLLVHGDVDRSAMVEHSRMMADAMAARGDDAPEFTYVEQRNGDHFLSLASHRRQFFQLMDAFLLRHLGSASADAVRADRPAEPVPAPGE